MSEISWNFKNWSTTVKQLQYKWKKISKEIWPINWNNFKKPMILVTALKESAYAVKTVFVVSSIGVIVSFSFLVYGLYLSLTVETADYGGTVQEAVVGGEIRIFNPVLEPTSEAENKINALLYLPLYYVSYPDFLANSQSNPNIQPVLLQSEPSWQDLNESSAENRYKILRFNLRSDLKWSNGNPITVTDVQYTFDRLKEERGNSQFRNVLSQVVFRPVANSNTQFDLVSSVSAPQLIYSANFSPISIEYYNSQPTSQLINDPRSFKPLVTSGYYVFKDGPVEDPDAPGASPKENPIRDSSTNTIKTIVLHKNATQNLGVEIFPERYVLRKFNTVLDNGGVSASSLERAVRENKVDLYSQSLGNNLGVDIQDINSKIGLQQKTVPSNTYFNLYLNIKINDYFINQTLRKYVLCKFNSFVLKDSYKSKLNEVPASRRFVPIQFGDEVTVDCADPEGALQQAKTPSGAQIYSIQSDEKTGIKRVLIFNEPFNITLVGLAETEPLLTDIQRFFLDIGVPADVISDERAFQVIQDKTYNAAFLPVTYAGRDPYPIYGATGQNLSQINQNNRVLNYRFEDNIKAYSISNLTDENAKRNLVDFFSKEFVSINLFQVKNQINYSNRVVGMDANLPNELTFLEEVYHDLPNWYLETRRKSR